MKWLPYQMMYYYWLARLGLFYLRRVELYSGMHYGHKRYKIPRWCNMAPVDHLDGIGGCWGISSGQQPEHGKEYCNGKEPCEFYRKGRVI